MHTLGCAHAILPMAPPEQRRDESAVATLARNLNRWGELCRKEGVIFSYHNHDFEFAPLGGTTMWDILVRETDPGLVYFELDLYWVRYGGADPEPLLSDLGDRIPLVHLKDMASDQQRSDLPVGEGTMPWNGLLRAADAAGVQWYVAEQDNPRDALEDVRISLQSMRELASE
jgi:sugar phosphate isomerase/epimerase